MDVILFANDCETCCTLLNGVAQKYDMMILFILHLHH